MKYNTLIFVNSVILIAVLMAGCTSSSSSDDLKFLDKVQESSNNIQENNEKIQTALTARDWSTMKEYSDMQLIQADQAIFSIQLLEVTGKRIPAREAWIQVLESTKSVAVHTGRAATAYEKGQISEGNNEMFIALDLMDVASEKLDQFNALDLT